MNRENVYFLPDGAPGTFDNDENLASLPLPSLEDTLERYYRNLLPFATEQELAKTRQIIEDFKNGAGKKLHQILAEKARKERNWVERYWEDVAYHSLKFPLMPYCNMAQPLVIAATGAEESREYRLKNLARNCRFSADFWKLIRTGRLRPPTNPDGSLVFSANLFRRLFNTCRVPGEDKDEIHEYLKLESEGTCPSVGLILGRGRVFYFDFVVDGEILQPQEFLHVLTIARDVIENDSVKPGIPILTADERTGWARNRKHLIELSSNNAELLEIIESAAMVISFDDLEPIDYSEIAANALAGDYNSRWCDKTSGMISFKNGKIGLVGEHSSYDGTVSAAFSVFLLMSMLEEPEPDWDELPKNRIIPKEIKFQIDDHLLAEIKRMEIYAASVKNTVLVQCQQFEGYGKSYMKDHKIHPDSFVQMALQWAYYKMHKSLAPTYETATMRVFYHGRTETVRSCSIEVKEWIDKMIDPRATASEKAKLFKNAANAQTRLMNEARKGNGIDRHLFGLWCVANENGIPIPEFYDDPLYAKSGGGGNFTLSTSTLGYTITVGFVAPMVTDGYGVFYSMLNDCVWIIITAYRDSEVTSTTKFYNAFASSMNEIKDILDASNGAKL